MPIVPAARMESTTARVLVADHQGDVLEALRRRLGGERYEAERVTSTDAVVDRLRASRFDLLLMDLNYTRDTTSGREGLDLILRVRACDPLIPIVVMTGWRRIDGAVDVMRRGASSFVQKPWHDAALRDLVQREIGEGAARRQDLKQRRDLDDARLIQRALLPRRCRRWTRSSRGRLAADGRVGGDCFDVIVDPAAFNELVDSRVFSVHSGCVLRQPVNAARRLALTRTTC